jgi:CBS domain containing-hemolysin-like protein
MDDELDLDSVLRTIDIESLLSDEARHHYHTLGGLAISALGRVPRTGDVLSDAVTDSRWSIWTGIAPIASW